LRQNAPAEICGVGVERQQMTTICSSAVCHHSCQRKKAYVSLCFTNAWLKTR